MFTLTITNGNKVRKETACTEQFAVNRAKALANLGNEVEVRDKNYGLIYWS